MQSINPYRTDIPFRILNRFAKGNPYVIAVAYFCLSYVGLYLLGYLTGRIHGNDQIKPMYTFVLDNINLAFLSPVGLGLLCHLYNTIQSTFQYLPTSGLIPDGEVRDYHRFTARLELLYNNKWAVVGSWSASIGLNTYNYIMKTDSWLGWQGGLPGLYGRLMITLNFYAIAFILYKCAITVWALHYVMGHTIHVRPMHPDRCGGLRPIGRLSFAINYFMVVILAFCTLLAIADPFARRHVSFVLLILFLYAISPVLLFGSLAKAFRVMSRAKAEALRRLSVTFDHYYEQLTAGEPKDMFDIKAAEEISQVYGLYDIVAKMPVWPFDFQSIARLVTTTAFPLVSFVISQLLSGDSVFNHILGKFSGGG